jgi:hypothetical protein
MYRFAKFFKWCHYDHVLQSYSPSPFSPPTSCLFPYTTQIIPLLCSCPFYKVWKYLQYFKVSWPVGTRNATTVPRLWVQCSCHYHIPLSSWVPIPKRCPCKTKEEKPEYIKDMKSPGQVKTFQTGLAWPPEISHSNSKEE